MCNIFECNCPTDEDIELARILLKTERKVTVYQYFVSAGYSKVTAIQIIGKA